MWQEHVTLQIFNLDNSFRHERFWALSDRLLYNARDGESIWTERSDLKAKVATEKPVVRLGDDWHERLSLTIMNQFDEHNKRRFERFARTNSVDREDWWSVRGKVTNLGGQRWCGSERGRVELTEQCGCGYWTDDEQTMKSVPLNRCDKAAVRRPNEH
jgi:hypothetical protein